VEVEDGEQIVAQNYDVLRVYIRLGEDIFLINTLMRLPHTSHQLRVETKTFASEIRKFYELDLDIAHQMRFCKAFLELAMAGVVIEIQHVDLEKREEHLKEIWATSGLEGVAMATFVEGQRLLEEDLRSVIRAASKARRDEEAFEKVRKVHWEHV
jgi:hypothetical protein